ncbi:polyketide synthase [Halenospora varia]|nr:polyketide synthase [Halenospora varia]
MSHEPIAIIGSGCRFPGESSTPSKLWDLLKEPRDVLSKIPNERFNPTGFYHPDGLHHATSNVTESYFLSENPRLFDAQFFGIKPVEANAIDPQQRLLIETVYESLEAAGIPIESLSKSNTSVFVGLMCEDYSIHLRRDPDITPIYTATGIARSIISNRISYFFDWHGPSVTIDTACSSSLVAVHQAVQSLRTGECGVAVAAGANLILAPELYIAESKLKMLSPESRSRMWDADANGYARGEGIASIILKRLSDAIRDGDHIECVIRETGVNQDGRTKGITMPSASAQTSLISDTYTKSGLDLNNPLNKCQYFEAHGTGTPAGDPQEAEAISKAFFGPEGKSSDHNDILYVGSVKTVIGHTEGTAGLAGLLKASLAIQHGIIPPNMHFQQLSSSVAPFYNNLQIPCTPTLWPELAEGQPRRASVNSFGFGGTNAHAILESYESSHGSISTDPSASLGAVYTPFIFSAASDRSLSLTLEKFASFLTDDAVDLRALSYALTRRSNFALRTSVSASSVEGLRTAIAAKLEATSKKGDASLGVRSIAGRPSILGVFTGQGAQWATMGKRLIQGSEFVRRMIKDFDDVLARLPETDRPEWSIKEELFAEPTKSRLSEAALSQPLCTAIQIVLVELLRAAGVSFNAVVGHSSGEIAAAFTAGFITAHDALKIAYYRGLYAKLAGNTNGMKGSMLAVGTSLEDATEVCELPDFEGRISVAATNSPSSVTLSGDSDAIQEVKIIFEEEKKFARLLKVDTAYHSHHMLPCSAPYTQSLAACDITVNQEGGSSCAWFSSVHEGKLMVASDDLKGNYWKDNMVNPVMFAQAVRSAVTYGEQNYDIALEVGPHPALQGPALQTIQDVFSQPIPYSGLLSRGKDDIDSVSNALGFLWIYGGESAVDFNAYDRVVSGAPTPSLPKNLPSYAWDHNREYWVDSRASKVFRSRSAPIHELLGTRCVDTAEEFCWRNNLRQKEISWLSGHALQGQTVFPAAAYISTVLEAVKVIADSQEVQLIELQDFIIGRAISFEDDDNGVETRFTVNILPKSGPNPEIIEADFKYHSSSSPEVETMVLNASGRLQIILGKSSPTSLPPRSPQAPNTVEVNSDLFYSTLDNVGYQYTGPFRALSSMKRALGFGTAKVANPLSSSEETSFILHPAMLDAAIQSVFLAFCWPGDGSLRELHVPTAIKRIRVNPSLCKPNLSGESFLPLDSFMASHESSTILGDVDIYTEVGDLPMVQVEGISVVPFASAVAATDRQLFSTWTWGVENPDGELVTNNDRATAEEFEIASITEQTAVYFLKELREVITQEDIDRSEWHHKKLFEFADHVLAGVSNGTQPFSKKHWLESTREEVYTLMSKYPDSVEMRLVRAVGEHLADAVRGKTNILEHLMHDNLLNTFYEQGHGIIEHTEFCARMVEQIVHRYPKMKMLEIGAGTGGATKRIFKHIGESFSSYTFTDISTGFFEKAQEIFPSSKMIFKALDCEKDIASQGYVEHSYDIVIASLVLHATEFLEQTMTNVRRLLKPGGFLVLLELTSDGPMRLGFCMSGLSGWWLGHKDGRCLSPLATSAQWHSVLLKTGFSGVDAITPEVDVFARPCFVIASQAIDDRVASLRQPLQSRMADIDIEELVILGGTKLETMRLADRISRLLSPRCGRVTRIRTLSETNGAITSRSHVISITELDEPIFKSVSEDMIEGFKQLLNHSKTLLWVTKGCREANPYANITVGFGRTLALEMPFVRTQFLDLDPLDSIDPTLICESALRLCFTDTWEENGLQDDLLWSSEPEVIQKDGRVLVPRLRHLNEANERYNSGRRTISKEVEIAAAPVTLYCSSDVYGLRRSVGRVSTNPAISIQVQKSLLAAIRISWASYSFLVLGINKATGEQVIALSDSNSSVVDVPETLAASCSVQPSNEGQLLSSIAHELLANYLISLSGSGKSTLVHNADQQLAAALRHAAFSQGKSLMLTTTLKENSTSSQTFLHPMASQREIKALLPENIGVFVDLGKWHSIPLTIASILPQHCNRITGSDLFTSKPENLSRDIPEISQLLEGVSKVTKNYGTQTPGKATIEEVIDAKTGLDPFTIVDWMASPVLPVIVQPIDSTTVFRGDMTYVLFGLTSDLAQTLCHWMVQHGARYVAMTSRNPKIEPKWLKRVEALGATVKIFSNDISDEAAVEVLCKTIADTLPPIAGIANGAMVLVDTMIGDLSVDSLERVLKPKVNGSAHLEKIFADADLDFFIFFSSIAAIYGNEGQSNYGAANMYMTSLAYQRRARGRAASVIHIGPITGSGYITREASNNVLSWVQNHGHCLLSERDFVQGFAEAILTGDPLSVRCPEIVLDERAPIVNLEGKTQELADPKFQHVIKLPEATDSKRDGMSASVPVKTRLLAATAPTELYDILRDAFLLKLQIILQLSDVDISQPDILEQGANELGMDSLIAVDLRTWFLKELDVDMPVLKILGGMSVRDLLAFALEKLPEKLTSSLPFKIDGVDAGNFQSPLNSSTEMAPESSGTPDVEDRSSAGTPGRQTQTPSSSIPTSKAPSVKDLELHSPTPVLVRSEVMSFGQARFWSLMSFLEDPTTLNIACLVRMTGNVRVADLDRAVQAVSQQHEALRTCFYVDENHQPSQGVLPNSLVKLETKQIKSGEASAEFTSMKKHVFNLGGGETMRVSLLTENAKSHYIIIAYHHIVMDGVSLEVFLAHLQKAYNRKTISSGILQYPDFSLRQRKEFNSGALTSELSFWRKEFTDIPSPLPLLPFAETRSRRPLLHYEFNNVNRRLDDALATRIRGACRKHKTTPFHFFLATYKALLFRLLRSDDLCIGMADANRIDSDVMNSIGCYLNLLPLRFKTTPKQKFADALKEARAKSYLAIANSKVPFDVLLEEIHVPRSALHSPLFQAFINYRQGVVEARMFGESQAEAQEYLIAKTSYDFTLDILEDPNGSSTVGFMVQKSLYSDKDANTLIDCYVGLLDEFSRNPEMDIVSPALYSKVEMGKAIELGRGPSIHSKWPETLVHRVSDVAQTYRDTEALKDSLGCILSYSEMWERVNAIADALKAGNVQPGEVVSIFQEPTANWVCSMLAIMHIGAIYAPLDLRISIERLNNIAQDCNPSAVLIHDASLARSEGLVAPYARFINISAIRASQSAKRPIKSSGSEAAAILYTSGSTGVPKGIILKHSSLINEIEDSATKFGLNKDRVLQQSALSFDMSIWQTFNALANGGSLYVTSKEARIDPSIIAGLVVSENISVTCGTPSEYISWIRADEAFSLRKSLWRKAILGGEQVTESHIQAARDLGNLQHHLFNGYGPTEVTIISNSSEVPHRDATLQPPNLVPAGRTSRNCSVYILDEDKHVVPIGMPGEIFIGGAGVSAGYLGNTSLTEQSFLTDPFASPGQIAKGWRTMHKTGDRGRLQQDGSLMIEGRITGDTQIKLRGLRIDLQDIENVILQASRGVLVDAVVAVHGESQFLISYVVFSPTYPSTSRDAFTDQLAASLPLPQYMCPAGVIAIDSMPLSEHGKVNRLALASRPLPLSIGVKHGESERECNPTELLLKQVWEEVLSKEILSLHDIGPKADFFNVGGNSALLVRLQKSIQKTFGVVLPLVQLFDTTTLSAMASKIQRSASESAMDWEKETSLNTSLSGVNIAAVSTPLSAKRDGKVILITGATGNLGRAILRKLIADPSISFIHCVAIRKPDSILDISPKISIHSGDLTSPNLGLQNREFATLASTVDLIIHSGAQRSFWESYHTVKAANFNSTKEIVSLARSRQIPIHFISSGGVFSFDSNAQVGEKSTGHATPPTDGSNGYVASKWASEKYLEAASKHFNMPVFIHRPLQAPGTVSNEPPKKIVDEFLRVANLMKTLPSRDAWNGSFDLLPLDSISGQISSVAASRKAPMGVRYLHYEAEVKVDARGLFAVIEKILESAQSKLVGAKRIPAIDWVGEAKKTGLRYFFAAQDLVFEVDGDKSGEILASKR